MARHRAVRAAPPTGWRMLLAAALALCWSAALAVDANSASAAQLEELRGIGPAISARIIAERTRAGAFLDMDDLRERVKGIGVANLKKFAAAGLTVQAPPGRTGKGLGPASKGQGATAMRQSWVGRTGVVYYDPAPEADAGQPHRPEQPHAPSGGATR